ncbi:heavy metal-binding protein HIP [Larimichthys crocea]|uniref:heavy metal-binding protein HIP n=1 Tax=Larimichthys crocea TaxID=215358 RepID=UPI000622E299|nr:heavy metal-binding protein HIP [Larimichthys crocea]
MRSASVFLVLLLCLHWTWAQGESGGETENDITQSDEENKNIEVQFEIQGVETSLDQSSNQRNITPDIWAELKELRDMAIEHRIKIEKLEQDNTFLEARMSSSENEMDELKRENAHLLTRVTASENKNTALEARMSSSEKEVEELKKENTERPKVAFSVGLTNEGHVGPFNTDVTLKFTKIFTNIGQAYSPITGIFTAPVRGAYYFRFTVFDNRALSWLRINVYHNGKRMMWNSVYNDDTGNVFLSNALVLQLEKGDVIYTVLPSNSGVADYSDNLTCFDGFLLFPL